MRRCAHCLRAAIFTTAGAEPDHLCADHAADRVLEGGAVWPLVGRELQSALADVFEVGPYLPVAS